MKLKHLMYILAASLMLFSVSVPATAAIANEQTASPAANATPDGYPNSSNGSRGGGGGGGGSSAPGGFKGPAKPKPKPNKGKKSKKKNSKKKKKKKKKSKTQAQKYNEAKKKGKKVSGNNSSRKYPKKSLPTKYKKYSSLDLYDKKGKLKVRRYYGENKKVQTDIHYDNHGNPKKHPKVPHRHDWKKNKKGELKPGPWY